MQQQIQQWLADTAEQLDLSPFRQLSADAEEYGDFEALVDYARLRIYSYEYANVPKADLAAYTVASLLKAQRLYQDGQHLSAVECLDHALIISGDQGFSIHEFIHQIETQIPSTLVTEEWAISERETISTFQVSDSCLIAQEFWHKINEPVVIKNAINDWPALQKWRKQSFWYQLGHRWVPVEIGRKYTDEEWTQKILPLSEFLHSFSQNTVWYLAQHDLLEQIPALKQDIKIPLCLGQNVQRRIWIGPAGTVSPLHHDPYHNVFAQVVGFKQVMLFPPKASVYPHNDALLSNTSQVLNILS